MVGVSGKDVVKVNNQRLQIKCGSSDVRLMCMKTGKGINWHRKWIEEKTDVM